MTVFKRKPHTCGCAATSARKSAYGGTVTMVLIFNCYTTMDWKSQLQGGSTESALEHAGCVDRDGGTAARADHFNRFADQVHLRLILSRPHIILEVVKVTPRTRNQSH